MIYLKEFIVCLCVLFISLDGFSQLNFKVVPANVGWKVGDSFNYRVQKVKKQWHYDERIRLDSFEYETQINIVGFKDSKYMIKWSNNCFLDEYANVDEIKNKFNEVKNKEIIYSVNEQGVFIGIENWEEWTSIVTEISAEKIDFYTRENGGITPYFIVEAEKSVGSFFRSKDGLELMIFDELALFHFALGLELTDSDTLKSVENMRSPIREKPMKGDVKLYYDKVDLMNNICVVNYEVSLNPKAVQEYISELFEDVADSDYKAMKKVVNLNQTINYKRECSPALPLKIRYQKDFNLELGDERASGIEWVLIERIKD